MTFATELEEQNSQRYMLVRLTSARHVTSGLSVYSGSVRRYQFGFGIVVADVKRNGTSLTRVSTLADCNSSGEYYVDEEAGDVYVYPVGSFDANTDHYIVFQYIFATSAEAGVVTYETPTDSASSNRLWQPRVLEEPEVSSAVSDVFVGIFTLAESQIVLSNADSGLFRYAGADDSFAEKAIDVWMSVNDQLQKIYRGRINSAAFGVGTMTVGFYDDFSKLDRPAYMSDETDEAIFLQSGFSSLTLDSQNVPVPFVIGKSRYGVKTFVGSAFDTSIPIVKWSQLGGASVGYGEVSLLDPDYSTPAVCTDYDDTVSTVTNREWGIARTFGDFRTLSFGSPTGSVVNVRQDPIPGAAGDEKYFFQPDDASAGTTTRAAWQMDYASTPDGNLRAGDSFKYVNGATTYYLVVAHVGANYVRGYFSNRVPPTSTSTLAVSDLQTNQAPALVIVDSNSGQTYWPSYGLDFTYAIATTAGGNKYMTVTFVNSFETATTSSQRNHPNMTPLHPSTHQVYFLVEQSSSSNRTRHDEVLKKIMEAAGLTCNASSFSTAGSALSATCNFQIPNYDEFEIGTYRKYAQDLLRSVLGFAALNSSHEVVYKMLEAPSVVSTETDNNVFTGLSTEIDYKDIATGLIAYNPHLPPDAEPEVSTSDRARYLHEIDNRRQFQHVLADISARLPTIMAVLAERRALYSFDVASRFADAALGDDVNLVTSEIPGELTERDLKILGITKNSTGVKVLATDVEGI